MTIKATAQQMYGYFDALAAQVADHPGFFIRFGRHVLKLTFPTAECAGRYESTLRYVMTGPVERPDGAIHLLVGEIMDYLPMKQAVRAGTQWLYEGEAGTLTGWHHNGRLSVYDNRTHAQYLLISDRPEEYPPPWHPFRFEFHNFAQKNGYLFLHGAAVGVGDQGVLISATGGSGKSTTVLGALLDGMDYVSDDYLIWEEETGRVYPLYSCGILNADSLERIPELKPRITAWVPNRENRAVLDLNPYTDRFVPGMKLRAVLCPRIPQEDTSPAILPDPVKTGKMQMAVSTARQNGYGLLKKDPAFLNQIMQAVKDLPCYELRLSRERGENTGMLKEWIQTLQK